MGAKSYQMKCFFFELVQGRETKVEVILTIFMNFQLSWGTFKNFNSSLMLNFLDYLRIHVAFFYTGHRSNSIYDS